MTRKNICVINIRYYHYHNYADSQELLKQNGIEMNIIGTKATVLSMR